MFEQFFLMKLKLSLFISNIIWIKSQILIILSLSIESWLKYWRIARYYLDILNCWDITAADGFLEEVKVAGSNLVSELIIDSGEKVSLRFLKS